MYIPSFVPASRQRLVFLKNVDGTAAGLISTLLGRFELGTESVLKPTAPIIAVGG